MKKGVLFICCICISQLLFGQKTIIKKYESEELQDIRELKIYLPKNYDKDSISNFPLTIVLDSDYLFDLYKGNAELFAYKDKAPGQIIVGIDISETRNKDVSFLKTNSKLTSDSNRFYRFIRDEMLIYIEANYKTSPFLTIVGDRLSANFITHFLQEKTPIFNAYICINPTLAPDINQQIQSYQLDRLQKEDNTFYFYSNSNQHIGNQKHKRITEFNTLMKSIGIKNFNVTYDYLEDSPGNVSAIGEAIPRALSRIFEIYSGISKEEFDTKVKNLSPLDAIAYLETKYLDIEFLFGTNLGIRESDILAIEKLVAKKENGDYLKVLGEMVLKLHPTSALGDYYMGRYYEEGKNYKKALEHYRIGYGKMDPSDPNADKYYENVERMLTKG